jgi:hypothetical protein
MARNRVQHQKGLSDAEFERRYGSEDLCRAAWFAKRWPNGFQCPRCRASKHSVLRTRNLLQCSRCRYQVSLIAGTMMEGTKLSMTVWFRAMHLLTQGKKGLSSLELGRRLGISYNAAWRLQQKIMQAMLERDRTYPLGTTGGHLQIDDVYAGGESTGRGTGRGRPNQTPFIAAVETAPDGRPLYARLQVVVGFRRVEVERLCCQIAPDTTVVSDSYQGFRAFEQPHLRHVRYVTGSTRASARMPEFFWVNTFIANVKNSLVATYRAVRPKHLPRYLGQFQWRFNRRFNLQTIVDRLAVSLAVAPPMPYRLLKLAESRW